MVDKRKTMESPEQPADSSSDASTLEEADCKAKQKHHEDEESGAVLGNTHVEAGTYSTDNPEPNCSSKTSGKIEQDGSVVSAMTDAASIDGQVFIAPALGAEAEETSSQHSSELLLMDNDVPKQVILDSENLDRDRATDDTGTASLPDCPSTPPPANSAPDQTLEGGAVQTPLVVTATPNRELNSFGAVDETISLPERTPKANELSYRSAASDADARVAAKTTGNIAAMREAISDHDDSASLDDYIRSPEVQNAIVERSPGGRYVRFMEKLGSGASKDVFRAYDTQEGIEVAWNVVNLSGVPKSERNRIVNEVRLLERLHHHNIISFHGSWVNRERQEVNFVTEILSSGTLKSFINKVQVIRWKIAKRWAVQILKGLQYLHSQDPPVIHRDLKCENIFINGTSGDLRIGDLGLSTVHRNGRVLSVLGTPEFMAPDMYEENSYDTSVDVYAFGMCLLEIFTKEIPYCECRNPAQIYKKVSAGEPPEVLSRLQSRHAREFVMMCLGYRDEDGKYVRPTVEELLQHEFWKNRPNDDDEVVVSPPLRERAIAEEGSSMVSSVSGTPIPKRKNVGDSQQSSKNQTNAQSFRDSTQHNLTESTSNVESNPPQPLKSRNLSVASSAEEDDEDGDRFEEMQQSEINMRKVKVMMGRGQELKEEQQESEGGAPLADNRTIDSGVQTSSDVGTGQQQQQSSSQQQSFAHYLVAAAVIEHENPHIRPYADDILKLVVTLPVDGQTQNVQFDFHLVEDDPVQVAKEMVQELGIPQGAVLEISETISGLARTARMKQDKHASWMQNLQEQHMQYQQGMNPGQHVQLQQGSATIINASHDQQQLQAYQGGPALQQIAHPQHGQHQHPSYQHAGQPLHHMPPPQHHDHQQQQQQYQQSGQPSHHISMQGNAQTTSQQDLVQYQHSLQHQGQHHNIPQDVAQYQQGQVMQQLQQPQGGVPGSMTHQQLPQVHHGQQQHINHRTQSNHGHQHGLMQYQQHGMQPSVHVQHIVHMPEGNASENSQFQQHATQPMQQHMHHQQHLQQVHQDGSHLQQHHGIPSNIGGHDSSQYHLQHPASTNGNSHEMQLHLQHLAQPNPVSSSLHPSQQQPHIRNVSGTQEHTTQPPVYSQSGTSGQDQSMQQQQQQKQQGRPPIYSQPATGGQQEHSAPGFSQPPVISTSNGSGYAQPPGNQDISVQHHAYHNVVPGPTESMQHQQQYINAPHSATRQLLQSYVTQGPTHDNARISMNSAVSQVPMSVPSMSMPAHVRQQSTTEHDAGDNPSAVALPHLAQAPSSAAVLAVSSRVQDQNEIMDVRDNRRGEAMLSYDASASVSHSNQENSDESNGESDLKAGSSDVTAGSDTDADEDDDEIAAELRRLDEEMERNLQRAKKVFDSRMDSLQRSQVEREAQHLKTLEKHEKERAEFEKRLQNEAEQQNRRIELLQREWDKKRETVALHKRKQKNGTTSLHASQDSIQLTNFAPSSASTGHVRNASTASSILTMSPAMSPAVTSHKNSSTSAQNDSDPGFVGQTER
jgi:WNK lysine deficient protein kinase